jgi:hypothetical protein
MGRLNRWVAIGLWLVAAHAATAQSNRQDIPFELYNGYLIVVKGSVGDLKNLSLVVDTGARHTVVDEWIAHKLHLKPIASVEQQAPGHIIAMKRVLLPQLSWSGGTVTALNSLTYDLSPLSSHLGIRIDMLLGLDVLKQSNFQIDFRSHRIHFGGIQEPENSVPMEPDLPYPIIEARINGQKVRLLMDTGSDSVAVLADRLPKANALPWTEGRGRDLKGALSFSRIYPPQVFLGDVEIHDAKVFLLPSMPETTIIDGNFSPNTLKASRIYFDFEHNRFGWDQLKSNRRAASSQGVASALSGW